MRKFGTQPLAHEASRKQSKRELPQQWATSGWIGYITLPCGGSTTLQNGGQSQKWSTSGRIDYTSLAILRLPNASLRRTNSAATHEWAHCLHTTCCPGVPKPHSKGQTQNRPTSGRFGYIMPTMWGVPKTSQQRTKPYVADNKVSGHPQKGGLVTQLLPTARLLKPQSRAQSLQWPTSGRISYTTPVVLGVPKYFTIGDKGRGGPQVGGWAR